MESTPNFLGQDCTNFQKSRSHLKILGARKVKRSMVYTEEPHILGATKQYLAATLTWCPKFVIVIETVIDFHIPSIQRHVHPGWRSNGNRSNSSVFLFILCANAWERAGEN
jgi:hypothetical protein